MRDPHKESAYLLGAKAIKDALEAGELLGEFDENRAAWVEHELRQLIKHLEQEADKFGA